MALVEDLPVNQELANAMLMRKGHRVTIARNGKEALTAVQQQVFDLILMDIQMPVMDGITATKLIRLLPGWMQNIPIIALTANVLPEQIQTFIDAGMTDHIGKPIKLAELHATIARNAVDSLVDYPVTSEVQSLSDVFFDEIKYSQTTSLLSPTSLATHLEALVGALDELNASKNTPDDIKRAAHQIITQAGMFGFNELSSSCRDLENTLINNGPVDQLLARIDCARVQTEVKMARLIKELVASPANAAAITGPENSKDR